jgi:hypothetical protein
MARGKGFFSSHAKSSAALVSLALHAVLLLVALTFVAVKVIQKEEAQFESRTVSRPKMPLKKLQVPINVKKQTRQPKLRKRIVVQPKMNQTMPDIKMPEITGIKGGLGNAAGGGIGAGSLGFTMPEIEIFGVRGKGEKILIILDSTPWMMGPERGGIASYTLIKDELVRILGSLNSTVLFNVVVYGHGSGSYVLFPRLVPASHANTAKVEVWLKPLNSVQNEGYGTHTLGPGGSHIEEDLVIEPLRNVNHWTEPALYAMWQQVDTVFLLANGWGHILHQTKPARPWSPERMERNREIEKKAREKLAEENRQLKESGQSPFALVGSAVINRYFPGTEHPPQPERHWYTPGEIAEAFIRMREASAESSLPPASGLGRKDRRALRKFTFNVIQFIPEDGSAQEERFRQLSGLLDGEYRVIPGLKAIQSYIDSAR